MSEFDDHSVHRLIDLATSAYALELENEVTSHPTAEILIAFQEGRLEPGNVEELREHLAACPECVDELERLDAFDRDDEVIREQAPAAENAAALSYARFQERTAARMSRDRGGAGRPVAPAPGLTRGRRWPILALAASVLFALVGTVAFFEARQPDPGSTAAPVTGVNPFVFDLLPDGLDALRDSAAVQSVEVPAGMDPLVFRLLLGDQTSYSSYSANLIRDSGADVWNQADLRRQPAGNFAVMIPRKKVPPGDYRLRLVGETGNASRALASYSFRLRDLE